MFIYISIFISIILFVLLIGIIIIINIKLSGKNNYKEKCIKQLLKWSNENKKLGCNTKLCDIEILTYDDPVLYRVNIILKIEREIYNSIYLKKITSSELQP